MSAIQRPPMIPMINHEPRLSSVDADVLAGDELPFERWGHALNVEEMKRVFALNPPDFLFLNQVSNVTGTVVPVEEIAEAGRILQVISQKGIP